MNTPSCGPGDKAKQFVTIIYDELSIPTSHSPKMKSSKKCSVVENVHNSVNPKFGYLQVSSEHV